MPASAGDDAGVLQTGSDLGSDVDPEASSLPLLAHDAAEEIEGSDGDRAARSAHLGPAARSTLFGGLVAARRRSVYLGLTALLVSALVAVRRVRTPLPAFAEAGPGDRLGADLVELRGVAATTVKLVRSALGTGDRLTSLADAHLEPDFELDGPTVDVNVAELKQEILGFGGAFTEAAAHTFSKLSGELQDILIEKYFGPTGIGYTMGRVHINSCDFSLGNYNFDDVADDFDLKHFDHSVAHDKEALIPLIQKAKKKVEEYPEEAARRLRLLASPWSPPGWMKVNGQMDGSNRPCLKTGIEGTWAKYISAWVSAYKNAGLPIWAMTVQNEPSNPAGWEACVLSGPEEVAFLSQHLGPTMQADHPEVDIFLFDDQKHMLHEYVDVAMREANAAQYVKGAAFHWYSGDLFDQVASIHGQYPDLVLLPSEATYERRMWEPGMVETYSDWRFGEGYAHDIIGDLNAGAAGWIDWNLLLDKDGGPNHVGNVCDAAVVADCGEQLLNVHPQYYFIGHFSKFFLPGSRLVATTIQGAKPYYAPGSEQRAYGSCTGGGGLETTAALRPDRQIAVVVLNCGLEEIDFKLRVGARAVRLRALPRSIQTVLLPKGAAD